MVETAVIFGMQRCGSNFFLSACSRFDDLTVFGEMYHRGGVFPFMQDNRKDFAIKAGLAQFICGEFQSEDLGELAGFDPAAPFTAENDALINAGLVKFAHKYPARYFAAVKQASAKSRLLFKIFPEHLSLFYILSVLRQHRPHVILMVRDPLDSFISYKKLTETKKPQDVDTSDLKITFNRAEYYEYKAQLVAYFKAIGDYCGDEGIDVTTVSYEELHKEDGLDKVEKVRGIVARVFKSPVLLRPDPGYVKLFTKQDKSKSPVQKVANPGQLPKQPQSLIV